MGEHAQRFFVVVSRVLSRGVVRERTTNSSNKNVHTKKKNTVQHARVEEQQDVAVLTFA